MTQELPDPEFVVADLLPQGLSLLAGRPKSGKSWLALLLAIAVALGRPCLGDPAPRRRAVLYLALEDTRRRLKKRAGQLPGALGRPAPDGLDLRVAWPRSGDGGLASLGEWWQDHHAGLVIVDTLGRFRDPVRGRASGYQDDYDALASLKGLADKADGGLLALHHTRKGAADDPFDEVSGTLGIGGATDAIMVLDRTRGQATAALYLTGRDLADQTLTLGWDAAGGVWSVAARDDGVNRPAPAVRKSEVERCADWLVAFLGEHAWPDKELEQAAEAQGYTGSQLKRAKAMLHSEDDDRRGGRPRLSFKPKQFQGEWWNWLGAKDERPTDRPGPYHGKSAGDTGESGDTGQNPGKTARPDGETGRDSSVSPPVSPNAPSAAPTMTGSRSAGKAAGSASGRKVTPPVSPVSPDSSPAGDVEAL